MSAALPRFEAGDTRQFTVTYSTAPSTPTFGLYTGSGNSLLVASPTVQSSSTTAFYAYVTLPSSVGVYCAVWVASYTVGPVVARDDLQVILTAAT